MYAKKNFDESHKKCCHVLSYSFSINTFKSCATSQTQDMIIFFKTIGFSKCEVEEKKIKFHVQRY